MCVYLFICPTSRVSVTPILHCAASPQALPQVQPVLPPLGAKLLLQPGHCDPTVNLYDRLYAVRGGTVVAIWPVAARGPGL